MGIIKGRKRARLFEQERRKKEYFVWTLIIFMGVTLSWAIRELYRSGIFGTW